jgi:hypothetical protein
MYISQIAGSSEAHGEKVKSAHYPLEQISHRPRISTTVY